MSKNVKECNTIKMENEARNNNNWKTHHPETESKSTRRYRVLAVAALGDL